MSRPDFEEATAGEPNYAALTDGLAPGVYDVGGGNRVVVRDPGDGTPAGFVKLTARYAAPDVDPSVYLAVDKIITVGQSSEGTSIDVVDDEQRIFRESVAEVMEAIRNA